MKVLWTCDELGLEFERTDIGREFGRNRKADAERPPIQDPGYLALNPNGRIPTIDDDGYVLWESNSIVRYLAARYGSGSLWPTEPRARADAERWMDWQLSVLILGVNPVFLHLIRTPADERDHAAIEQWHRRTITAMRILNDHLGTCRRCRRRRVHHRRHIDRHGMHRWLSLPVERPAMPHLERDYARLAERPGYRATIMQPLA